MSVNPEKIWEKCLESIKAEVAEQSFKTWFAPIKPIQFQNDILTIEVPSRFFYEWLEEHYVHTLKKAINNSIGNKGQLEYSVFVDQPSLKNAIQVANTKDGKTPTKSIKEPDFNRSPFEVSQIDRDRCESYLNPFYKFENYVHGDCNALARSAGVAVAAKPGSTAFNPLMIYGSVGLGKTHLLHAIGNQIKEDHPNKFVLYVSSEKFTNQFINAVKNNTLQIFSNFYMNVDVLLIDDVQFLANKDKTQETFFHIFNHLHQTGKQIVMSADRAPKKLEGFMDRLLSRFKWGLTADLQKPDYETRVAIIERKTELDGLKLSAEVVDYIAKNCSTNVRELEGVIISLLANASLNNKSIDLDIARRTIKGIVQKNEKILTLDLILDQVSKYYHMEIEDIKSKSRKKEVLEPRQMAMYLAKEHLGMSYSNLGYTFKRDHTAVSYAVNQFINNVKNNKLIEQKLEHVKKALFL